ncbi:Leucine Rich Repeat [Aquimarina amphilecti]|uniref:Leucine Rich Repeat n=1 Tax=Aquimarina amphilecti TaxID=1038014 RepID=A0A1H7QWQ3_AQUAM|nr:leucine-rich repeat domain-containing protein [Aquimarina amphilecti]SEL52431.1 Leucine Rich Repeat [Aquimarina amphilecti]
MKKITLLIICSLGFIINTYSQKKTKELWEHTEIGSVLIYYSLEEALKDPKKVRGLQIRDEGLEKIPKDIAKLVNLEYLRLHHNKFEEIPDFIFKMKKIRVLEIGGNRLGVIPKEIGEMTQLEFLGLKANGLTNLPESIGNLTNLKKLDLDFNPLITLPESIKNLTKLETLYFSHAKFSDVEIERIKKLLPHYFGN